MKRPNSRVTLFRSSKMNSQSEWVEVKPPSQVQLWVSPFTSKPPSGLYILSVFPTDLF
jgi:hypothetical protein